MNTQVTQVPTTQAVTAQGTSSVPVAETIPVALTAVAAAIPVAVPVVKATSLLDDFVDGDDTSVEEFLESAAESESVADSSDDGTIEDLEDDAPAEEIVSTGTVANADLDGLEDLEDSQTELQSMVVIDLYKPKCTTCTHLVPWGDKTHSRCHFSNGNENCPAQSLRFRRRIPFDEIIPRFLVADEQNDTALLIRLYEKLKEKPQDVQDEIHAKLKEARQSRALKQAA